MRNLAFGIGFITIIGLIAGMLLLLPEPTKSIIGSQVFFEGDTSTVVDVNYLNSSFILKNGKIIEAHQINKYIIKK